MNYLKYAKELIGIQMIIFFPATYIFIFLHYEFWLNYWGLSPAPIFKNSMFYLATFLFFFIIYNFLIKSPEFKKLHNEFHSDEMDSDIEVINEWLKINQIEDYYTFHQLSKEERPDSFNKVHAARKAISKRYNKIWSYYKNKRLKIEIKKIVPINRVHFLINKIEPLEIEIGKAIKLDYDSTVYIFFKKLYKI